MSNAIYDAVETLFAARHRIPRDAIRSLQSILFCAESALYHAPEGSAMDGADYATHDVTDCEAGNGPDPGVALPGLLGWPCCEHCAHGNGEVHETPCSCQDPDLPS